MVGIDRVTAVGAVIEERLPPFHDAGGHTSTQIASNDCLDRLHGDLFVALSPCAQVGDFHGGDDGLMGDGVVIDGREVDG